MKKQLLIVLLALCMVAGLLPMTALAAGTSETYTDFALRMQSEYDVKVQNLTSVTLTSKEQEIIERSLSLYGKDFIKTVSAGFGRTQMQIIITNNVGVDVDFEVSGAVVNNTIYLYPGWTYLTMMHEIAHAVQASWERKALDDYYIRNLDLNFYKDILKIQSYANVLKAFEEIPMILQNGYDNDWIEKAKRGEVTGVKEKLELFRSYYIDYLTGGATPCLLVDNILGASVEQANKAGIPSIK